MIKEEKGFTLIELIIIIAIIAIFSTTIVSVISTASRMMSTTSNTASVQTSIQHVTEQLKETILDTNGTIYYAYGNMFDIGMEVADRNDIQKEDARQKTLYLESKNDSEGADSKTYLEMIAWDPDKKQLLYQKVAEPYTTEGTVEVLANNVSDFRVDISKADTEQYVQFKVTIIQNGKQQSMSQTVSLRNSVEIKAPF